MSAELQQSPSAVSSQSAKILIVDDHEVMRLGIRNLLESRDSWSICAEAANGQEAIEKTRECLPDVIIMDVTMPTMNGLEASRHIGESHPEIPIILFSLHFTDDLLTNFGSSSIRGAVSKGEAGRDLVEAVQTVLSGGTFFPRRRS